MLDGALALPEYIIEFDFSPEMGKVRPPPDVHPIIPGGGWVVRLVAGSRLEA